MKLVQPLESHLIEMMRWFNSEKNLLEWAGPNFRYPFNPTTFTEDLQLDSTRSLSLVTDAAKLLAFGQYYKRLGRCHLSRLVVNPSHRSEGVAGHLLTALCEAGTAELAVRNCSLFVLNYNEYAIKAYRSFGFVVEEYPEHVPLPDCLYMVKSES